MPPPSQASRVVNGPLGSPTSCSFWTEFQSFGLGCPFYCSFPWLGGLLASFLLRLLTGVILCLSGGYFVIPWLRLHGAFVAPAPGSSEPPTVQPAKYLYERHR